MSNTKTKIRSVAAYIFGCLAWLAVILIGLSGNKIQTSAQTFIQSYGTSSTLQQGIIVRLNPSNSTQVEPASQSNIYQTFGVVVDASDASVTLSQNTNTNQVFVATNGHFNVLVDDQDGPIAVGDYITLSSFNGVGMKDDAIQPIVVGQALQAFNSSSPVIGTTTVKNGKTTSTVNIGLIQVNIGVSKNPQIVYNKTILPSFFIKASQTIAGKSDSAWRIYLAVILLGATAIMTCIMLYSGIRSSIISIGRNPLSHQSINRSLVQIIITALLIFIGGVIGVYLLLRI